MNNKILFISNNYPSNAFSNKGMFFFQLVQEFKKEYYCKVLVLVPKFKFYGDRIEKISVDKCEVKYLKFFSFSKFSNRLLRWIKDYSIKKSVENELKIFSNYKFVYVHFLLNALPILSLKEKFNFPIFVALGESNTGQYTSRGKGSFLNLDLIKKIDGFIVVSNELKNFCINKLNVAPEKIYLAPNAVNPKIFFPTSKLVQINKFMVPHNKFIISFLGGFINRKGIFELIEALNFVHEDIVLMCIGKGTLPYNKKIIFAESLSHSDVPKFLNASDIFVFPTKAEGSSNALLEAMACGLPVVTSDIPEVIEQLGKDNALFVKPTDVQSIANAINKLFFSEELRKYYGQRSIAVAKKYSLEERAKNINLWINNKIVRSV